MTDQMLDAKNPKKVGPEGVHNGPVIDFFSHPPNEGEKDNRVAQ